MKLAITQEALFTTCLGGYAGKGFTLTEHGQDIELRHLGVLIDKFTWTVPVQAIRNSCACWLIKWGDFGDGITIEEVK